MFLSFLMVLINGFQNNWFVLFFRLLFSLDFIDFQIFIIAIKYYSNKFESDFPSPDMDFAKMYFSYCINTDKDMEGAVARNSAIPEELGNNFLYKSK